MPIDYKKYPSNWKSEIRPAILQKANNCCEFCGVANGAYGYRELSGKFIPWEEIDEALNKYGYDYFDHELKHCYNKDGTPTRVLRIVITIAHLDHDVTNNDHTNLKALCQKCHLNYDKGHHRANASATIKRKKGLQSLF